MRKNHLGGLGRPPCRHASTALKSPPTKTIPKRNWMPARCTQPQRACNDATERPLDIQLCDTEHDSQPTGNEIASQACHTSQPTSPSGLATTSQLVTSSPLALCCQPWSAPPKPAILQQSLFPFRFSQPATTDNNGPPLYIKKTMKKPTMSGTGREAKNPNNKVPGTMRKL